MIWKKSHTAVYFYFYFFFIPPIFCSEPTTIFLDFIHLHDYPLTQGFFQGLPFLPHLKLKSSTGFSWRFVLLFFWSRLSRGPPGVATIYVLLLINAALFDTLCFRSSDDLIRRPCDFESVLPPKSSANVVVPVMVCLDGAPWHDLDGHLFSILRVFLYFLSIMSG